jgi:hypothetical protein
VSDLAFLVFQASLNSGEGGIVSFLPPNDEIVYQCGQSDQPGIQKVKYNSALPSYHIS